MIYVLLAIIIIGIVYLIKYLRAMLDELKDQRQEFNAVKEIQSGYKLTINDTSLNNSEIYYYPKCKFLVEGDKITAVNHKGDVIGSHSLDNRTYDLTKIGAND